MLAAFEDGQNCQGGQFFKAGPLRAHLGHLQGNLSDQPLPKSFLMAFTRRAFLARRNVRSDSPSARACSLISLTGTGPALSLSRRNSTASSMARCVFSP